MRLEIDASYLETLIDESYPAMEQQGLSGVRQLTLPSVDLFSFPQLPHCVEAAEAAEGRVSVGTSREAENNQARNSLACGAACPR